MMNALNNGRMIESFNGYCYTCYGFGHKANQSRSRMNGRNTIHENITCHNSNRPEHIAMFCSLRRNIRIIW